jgi:chloramphenicol 3-O phosphotransferase
MILLLKISFTIIKNCSKNIKLFFKERNNINKNGIIIILNGPSGSGKTTLAKKIIELWEKPILLAGLDNLFCNVTFPQYFCSSTSDEIKHSIMRGEWNEDTLNNKIFKIDFGNAGKKIIEGMHKSMISYATSGIDIVADYIQYEDSWAHSLKQLGDQNNVTIFFIKLNSPIDVIEEREKKRGTSPVGHARSHYKTVHNNIDYLLEIDVSKDEYLDTNARLIIDSILKERKKA